MFVPSLGYPIETTNHGPMEHPTWTGPRTESPGGNQAAMTTGLVYGSGAEDDVMGCEETVFVFHVTFEGIRRLKFCWLNQE